MISFPWTVIMPIALTERQEGNPKEITLSQTTTQSSNKYSFSFFLQLLFQFLEIYIGCNLQERCKEREKNIFYLCNSTPSPIHVSNAIPSHRDLRISSYPLLCHHSLLSVFLVTFWDVRIIAVFMVV